MKAFEDDYQIFIVRIWFEPREIENARHELRGLLEYVSTGERRYFRSLEDIPHIVAQYLDLSGIDKLG